MCDGGDRTVKKRQNKNKKKVLMWNKKHRAEASRTKLNLSVTTVIMNKWRSLSQNQTLLKQIKSNTKLSKELTRVCVAMMNHLNIFYSSERYLFSILTDELHLILRIMSLSPYSITHSAAFVLAKIYGRKYTLQFLKELQRSLETSDSEYKAFILISRMKMLRLCQSSFPVGTFVQLPREMLHVTLHQQH